MGSLLALTALGQQGKLEPRTPAAEAKKKIGQLAVMTGKVADVHKSEKVIQINIGPKYPKQDFTAVIFASDFATFPDVDKLKGQTVEISGKVEGYKGKPQIVLKSKGQLTVLQAAEKK